LKAKNKIIIIVLIQITIIIISFLVLVHFEQERTLIGNSINIAGKTRVLTMISHEEIEYMLYSQTTINPSINFNNIENNINFLKTGGSQNGLELKPLPASFQNDINSLEKSFSNYKKYTLMLIDKKELSTNEFAHLYLEFGKYTNELLLTADQITTKIGIHDKQLSEQLIFLQMLFMTIIASLHTVLVYLILSISKQESIQLLKTEKFAIIGELSSRIAHDLRNPLSIIKMAVDLIQKKEDLSPQVLEKTKIINTAISRMNHQINDVMNYVKTSPLNLTKNIIEEIIKDALDYSGIPKTIIVEFTERQTEIVCDKEKIFIVLVNLFRNANEAMKGTGKLTIKIKSLPQNIQIVIENSGPSIPTTNLDSIFTPLFTTNEKGTGLGLATCKNIISEHDGNIFAFNHPTRFVINIPQKI